MPVLNGESGNFNLTWTSTGVIEYGPAGGSAQYLVDSYGTNQPHARIGKPGSVLSTRPVVPLEAVADCKRAIQKIGTDDEDGARISRITVRSGLLVDEDSAGVISIRNAAVGGAVVTIVDAAENVRFIEILDDLAAQNMA